MSLILIKRLVILMVALLQVLGLILIAFGIWYLFTTKPDAGVVFIFIGSITMILAIFGFLAAIREALVRLLIYLGALALMIRIQVRIIKVALLMQEELETKIRQFSDFRNIDVPHHAEIMTMNMLMQLWGVIKTVSFLIIMLEVVGAVFVVRLYRSVKKSRLAENPVPSS